MSVYEFGLEEIHRFLDPKHSILNQAVKNRLADRISRDAWILYLVAILSQRALAVRTKVREYFSQPEVFLPYAGILSCVGSA